MFLTVLQAPYEQKAVEDKARYEKEMETYEKPSEEDLQAAKQTAQELKRSKSFFNRHVSLSYPTLAHPRCCAGGC